MTLESLLTRRSGFHLLCALPGIVLPAIFGTSLNGEWWGYAALFVVCICAAVVNLACIPLAVMPQCRKIYPAVSAAAYLLFIPTLCALILAALFGVLMLFGIRFTHSA